MADDKFYYGKSTGNRLSGGASIGKAVFNPNTMSATHENLLKVPFKPGVDTDSATANGFPQATIYGHIVPPRKDVDLQAPRILATVPSDQGFFNGAYLLNNGIRVIFTEAVQNAELVSNYLFQGSVGIGSLYIERVVVSPDRRSAHLIFAGSVFEPDGTFSFPDQYLTLTLNHPSYSRSPIQDDAGNMLQTESVDWYAEHITPWIEYLYPDPQLATLMTNTFNWVFEMRFSEHLPNNSWSANSQWGFTLKASGGQQAPLDVKLKAVEALDWDSGNFGPEDGFLKIGLYTVDPFEYYGIPADAAAFYDRLELVLRHPYTMTDRAGNSFQPESSVYVWNVKWVSSDTTSPVATFINPSPVVTYIGNVARTSDNALISNVRSVLVGFDEAVENPTDPSMWSVNGESGLTISEVHLVDSHEHVQAITVKFEANATTAPNAKFKLSHFLTDANGNTATELPLVLMEAQYPQLAQTGAQGVYHINHETNGDWDGEAPVQFTTAVKHMEPNALLAFYEGAGVTVYTVGTNGVETVATDVVASLKFVQPMKDSHPRFAELTDEQKKDVSEQIWAHKLSFDLTTVSGTPIPYGDGLYRIRLTLKPLYTYDGKGYPQVPRGNPSETNPDALAPHMQCAGWGNPLSSGLYSDIFSDSWDGVVYIDVQNHPEPVPPLEVLSVTPSEGSTISNDGGVTTFTFNQAITSINSAYVKVKDANGDWVLYDPQEYVNVIISGSSASLTYYGPNGGLYPAGEAVKFCVDEITLAADGSLAYGPWEAEYVFVDGEIAITDLVKNDNKVTLSVSLGADVSNWRVKIISWEDEDQYFYMDWDWSTANTEVEIPWDFDLTGAYTIAVETQVVGGWSGFEATATVDFDYSIEVFYNVIYEQVEANQTPEPTKIDLAFGAGEDVSFLVRTGSNPTATYNFPIVEIPFGSVGNETDFAGLENYARQYSFTVDQPFDDALGQMVPGTYIFTTQGSFDSSGTVTCGVPTGVSFDIEEIGDTWFQHGRHGIKLAPAGVSYMSTCLLTLETPDGDKSFSGAYSHSVTDSGKPAFIFGPFHWDVDTNGGEDLDTSYAYGNNPPNAQTGTPTHVLAGVHKATFAWSSGTTEIMDVEIKDHGLHVVFNEIGDDGRVEVTVTEDDPNGKMDTIWLYNDILLPVGGSAAMDVGSTYTTSELENGTYNYVVEGYSDTEESGATSPFADYAMYRWEGTFEVQNKKPTVYSWDAEYRTDSGDTYYVPSYNPNEELPVKQGSTSSAGTIYIKFSPKADQETYTNPPWVHYKLEPLNGSLVIDEGYVDLTAEGEVEKSWSHENFPLLTKGTYRLWLTMREADKTTLIGGLNYKDYTIDVMAPRYSNTGAVSGAITQNYGSEENGDQYTTTSMWRFLASGDHYAPQHSFYDPAFNALTLHYDEAMDTDTLKVKSLPDPRTSTGWDDWKKHVDWGIFSSDDNYQYRKIRETAAADIYGNRQNSWTSQKVFMEKIDKPILVDVRNLTPEDVNIDAAPQDYVYKGRFGGIIHMEGDVSTWTVDGDQQWSDVVNRSTQHFSYEATGNSYALPGVDHWKQYATDTFYEASCSTKTVVLELHYSEALEHSPEVILHGEHFAPILPWPMLGGDFSGPKTPTYFFGVPKPLVPKVQMNAGKGGSYFDPYPVSTPWSTELKDISQTYVIHRASLDGVTVASDEMCFIKLCEKGLETATADFNYYAGSMGTYDPPSEVGGISRTDRGDTRLWTSEGTVGKVVRVALNFESMLFGKVSVMPVPGHPDQYGIPICLEIRQKEGPYDTTLGPDRITFWLLWNGISDEGVDLTDSWDVDWWAHNDVESTDRSVYWPNNDTALGRTFEFANADLNLTQHSNRKSFVWDRQAIVGYTPHVYVASIDVTTADGSDTASLEEGSTLQLKVTATYSDGSTGDITSSTGLQWNSSSETNALVDDNGLVTGVLASTFATEISAKVMDASDSIAITVTDPVVTLSSIHIVDADGHFDFAATVGDALQLKALGTYSDSSQAALNGTDLSWSVSDSGAFTIDNYDDISGIVTLKASVEGSETVYATYGTKTTDVALTAKAAQPIMTSIRIEDSATNTVPTQIDQAGQLDLTVVGIWNNGMEQNLETAAYTTSWSISPAGAGTITADGVYTANTDETVVDITATVDGSFNDTVSLAVITAPAATITTLTIKDLQGKDSGFAVPAGQDLILKAEAVWSDGFVQTLTTTHGILWNSSDPTTATISSDGVVTGKRAGTATIKVSVTVGLNQSEASAPVLVLQEGGAPDGGDTGGDDSGDTGGDDSGDTGGDDSGLNDDFTNPDDPDTDHDALG